MHKYKLCTPTIIARPHIETQNTLYLGTLDPWRHFVVDHISLEGFAALALLQVAPEDNAH